MENINNITNYTNSNNKKEMPKVEPLEYFNTSTPNNKDELQIEYMGDIIAGKMNDDGSISFEYDWTNITKYTDERVIIKYASGYILEGKMVDNNISFLYGEVKFTRFEWNEYITQIISIPHNAKLFISLDKFNPKSPTYIKRLEDGKAIILYGCGGSVEGIFDYKKHTMCGDIICIDPKGVRTLTKQPLGSSTIVSPLKMYYNQVTNSSRKRFIDKVAFY